MQCGACDIGWIWSDENLNNWIKMYELNGMNNNLVGDINAENTDS